MLFSLFEMLSFEGFVGNICFIELQKLLDPIDLHVVIFCDIELLFSSANCYICFLVSYKNSNRHSNLPDLHALPNTLSRHLIYVSNCYQAKDLDNLNIYIYIEK